MKPILSKETIARFATMPKPADFRIFTHPKRKHTTPEERAEIVRLRNGGMALQDIADRLGRHINSIHRVVWLAVREGQCEGGRMRRAKP
jgi:transposase-like protein